MGKVVTGAYQATGKKMEGATPQSNFSKPPKMGLVKPVSMPSAVNAAGGGGPKPFNRSILPGTRVPRLANAGGIARAQPIVPSHGGLSVMPHVRNPGE